MRTTIEISTEMRAKLLALAARRGLRGQGHVKVISRHNIYGLLNSQASIY